MKIVLSAVLMLIMSVYAAFAQSGSTQKIFMKYKAYWGGFVIAEISTETLLGADSYDVSAEYAVKGLASIVGNMTNNTRSYGIRHRTGEYRPLYYESQGNFGKFKYSNKVKFNPDNLMVTTHEQELELREKTEYIPIPDAHKHGIDPMTMFLNMIVNENFARDYKKQYSRRQFGGIFVTTQNFICDETGKFEEESRSVFAGDAVGCKIDGELIAGGIRSTDPDRKRRRGREDDDQQSILWFGQVDGFHGYLPVYTEFPIGWGKVRVYLNEFTVEDVSAAVLTASSE